MNGLKAKKAKTNSHYPPAEISGKTKERRAWLAAKLAEISAKPNTEAKIVGAGSYQEVSEWTITYTEGRVRLRGICQLCGRSQVVESGTMVLHGYKRPGDGATYGRCPGTGKKPLQSESRLTVLARMSELEVAERIAEALPKAEALAQKARDAYYATEAYKTEARMPEKRYRSWGKPTSEEREAYAKALDAWKVANPISYRHAATQEQVSLLRTGLQNAEAAAEFYGNLIDLHLVGTPLEEEVVA
jgi:hypothetical protein